MRFVLFFVLLRCLKRARITQTERHRYYLCSNWHPVESLVMCWVCDFGKEDIVDKRVLVLAALLSISSLVVTACNVVSASVAKPAIVISSPASNSQFHEGEQVAVQSTSNDPAGIERVDLIVDGNVVRTDQSPTPQVSFTVIQTWRATVGPHTIIVRATNAANGVSDPAAVSVLVLASSATATPSTASSATPVARPCLNSTFVTDVTVPDGTALAAGQTFNKIWRVRNSGTCAWSTSDELVFVVGEPMTAGTVVALPATAPGATADLLVPMAAPGALGVHSGTWRTRSASGAFFGTSLSATINVVTANATPVSCPFTPIIHGFSASPTTITPGQSTSLNWGFVEGAQFAEIDNGIGGIATPGSTTVSPGSTTTYTLTAVCGGRSSTAQVTINVVSATAVPSATPTAPSATATATRTPTP
jgi:Ig-like domain-containing protein/Big-like domain-containing protein